MSFFVLIAVLVGLSSGVGCSNSVPTPGIEPKSVSSPLKKTTTVACDQAQIELSLGQRALLTKLASEHLVTVALSPRRCAAEILESCMPEGAYAYLDAASIRSGGSLPSDVRSLWSKGAGHKLLGAFVGPSQVRRQDLSSPDCDRATHFVRAFTSKLTTDKANCPESHWRPVEGCHELHNVVWSEILSSSPRNVQVGRMDRTEVTVADYQRCVASGACKSLKVYPPDVRESGRLCTYGVKGKERHPVNCISWSEAQTYCRVQGKRLPRSSEWSVAASITDAKPYLWGTKWPPPPGAGNFADERAKDLYPYWVIIRGYVDGFEGTAPVGIYGDDQTPAGILNLAGNVREWVADGRGNYRVARGASFGEGDRAALKIQRLMTYDQSVRSAHIGFRCIRDGGGALER